MADQNKDELAKLLGEMAGAEEAAPEEAVAPRKEGEADAWSVAPPPVPLRGGLPKGKATGTPAGPMPPQVSRQVVAAESRRPSQPAEVVKAIEPEAPVSADGDIDDDAVIVPAPSQDVLGVRPRRAPVVRQHVVKSLSFKQTIIPVLLTIGILCLAIVGLGFFSGEASPFYAFRAVWFSMPVVAIGLVFLGFAGVTMLQVRHQMVGRVATAAIEES
jgi:hypothetical protein